MKTPSSDQIDELTRRINLIPELDGAGIGFVGDDECSVLRVTAHSSGLKTYVVLQADDAPGPPVVPPEGPDIKEELVGIGFNCVGAVFSWAALTGEGLAAPASGGASAILVPLTYAAATSTSIQCGISLVRAGDIFFNDGNWTRWLNSNEYYPWASGILDVISLAGAAASASAAIRSVKAIRAATGRSWTTILKGLSRAERKRLAEELIRMEKPGISNGGLKSLIRMGAFPARLSSAVVTERLFNQLKDAISASLSLGGSAASGLIHLLYVHVVQE